MKYTILIAAIMFCTSCADNSTTGQEHVHTDSAAHADSLERQQEEDEVAEEIIEGSFDVLNR